MKQYKIKIQHDNKFSYSWGYALYSAFLERLKEETSNFVHEDMLFSQYLTSSKWIINTNSEYNFEKEYFLHKYNTTIEIIKINATEISEQDIADKFLIRNPYKRNIKLYFLTPTTFKQDGDYVLYPSKDLIMQSLTNKWNSWADRFVLEDMSWDDCKISKYNLKSVTYQLKDVKINGFVGFVELYFWGSESIIRLGNMICDFANYSGTGIKTSLGMGGTFVE